MCSDNDIRHFTSRDSKIKCAIVERVNRTLKGRMFKYFTAYGTRKYIDVLQQLVSAYNNKIHRSINMKPSEVNESNERVAYNNLYKNDKLKYIEFSNLLPIGSTVRKKYNLSAFDKSYYPNWTEETFKIIGHISRPAIHQYVIQNFRGLKDKKRYYPSELQHVNKNTTYRIDKIVRKRKLNNKTEYLVKWTGYPSTENSWISAIDLIKLNVINIFS